MQPRAAQKQSPPPAPAAARGRALGPTRAQGARAADGRAASPFLAVSISSSVQRELSFISIEAARKTGHIGGGRGGRLARRRLHGHRGGVLAPGAGLARPTGVRGASHPASQTGTPRRSRAQTARAACSRTWLGGAGHVVRQAGTSS